eukprot:4819628-Pyramimonas_sp.AAC.3
MVGMRTMPVYPVLWDEPSLGLCYLNVVFTFKRQRLWVSDISYRGKESTPTVPGETGPVEMVE